MKRYLTPTCWGPLVGLLALWAGDRDTARLCETKGRAWLLGGAVIECHVVQETTR